MCPFWTNSHPMSGMASQRAQMLKAYNAYNEKSGITDGEFPYLKGKDAESEEAQEHANSSSLALYA